MLTLTEERRQRNNMKRIILVTNLLAILIVISSCAIKPSPEKMIPHINYSSPPHTAKALKVGKIEGCREDNPFVPKIGSEEFKISLSKALKKSRFFERVVREGKSDYTIQSRIISHKINKGNQKSDQFSLFVIYKIFNSQHGDEIWKKSIVSHYNINREEIFFDPKKNKEAHEGAIRKNLAQLLKHLSKEIPEMSRN